MLHFRRHRPVVALLCAVTTAALVGAAVPAGAAATHPVAGAITVSAAASLASAFDRMGVEFRRRYPDATVRFNYGSSTTLATQIASGAPADVYAAADRASMDRLARTGAVTTTPVVLARSAMTIVVKRGNPYRVAGLEDLTDVPVVALCNASAPCGVYAARVLRRAGVSIPESHVTRGADASATFAAVATGDADAAVVYAAEVGAGGPTVTSVPIPADHNVEVVYRIAPVSGATPKVARAFVRFATSARGHRILVRNGFDAP